MSLKSFLDSAFVTRIKSLLWRAGAMAVAAFCAYIASNIGVLNLNPIETTMLGLVFGEISKHLNTGTN